MTPFIYKREKRKLFLRILYKNGNFAHSNEYNCKRGDIIYNENLLTRLNQYVIDMAALNVKLHNFHWNIVGPFFGDVHAFTQTYYEQVADMYDEVAERIKMINNYPETLLTVYSQQTKIQELESKDFVASEIIENIINDFEYLLDSSRRIESLASGINDTSTAGIFSGYIQLFEKELWMLKSKMK